jgi:hypothetical protein
MTDEELKTRLLQAIESGADVDDEIRRMEQAISERADAERAADPVGYAARAHQSMLEMMLGTYDKGPEELPASMTSEMREQIIATLEAINAELGR